MKAIILAAGSAQRLRPATDNTPKCLLKVGKRSLLQRTIDNLMSVDIKSFVIVTGYLSHMIEDFVHKTYPSLNVEFIHNDLYDQTNNIYSLWLAKPAIGNKDIILIDSDIIFDSIIIAELLKSPYHNCLAVNEHALGEEEIKVILDSENKILEISKVVDIDKARGESIGIELFSSDLLKTLFDELDLMMKDRANWNLFYEKAFERIIDKGAEIYAVFTSQYFAMEIDTPQDLEEAIDKLPDNLK